TAQRGRCGPAVGEAFVKAAYTDYIGRLPTSAELRAGVDVVGYSASSGASRSRFSQQLAQSENYVNAFVNKMYRDILGRNGDRSGLAYWRTQLRTGTWTPAAVRAYFYASSEYFRNLGGNSIPSWVTDLYGKLLQRRPDPEGLGFWVDVANTRGRHAVS